MEQEAFVYIWTNLANNNRYIGYHKGTQDDGYICSSKSKRFWKDYADPLMQWKREIVYTGSQQECVTHEHSLLMAIDLKSDMYYNNARGGMIIYTDEVREKLRLSKLGRKASEATREKMQLSKLGRKHSEATLEKMRGRIVTDETREKLRLSKLGHVVTAETREKLRQSTLKRPSGMKGKQHSAESREKLRLSNLGRKHSEATREKLRLAKLGRPSGRKGKLHSAESREKMRLAALRRRSRLGSIAIAI